MSESLMSIVIVIQILLLRISSEDTFDCTGHEDDSFHPMFNANNCRYYWQCIYVDTVYMRAIKRTCPAGTEFDTHLKECEISGLVNCVNRQSSDMLQTSTSTKKYSILFSRRRLTTTQKTTFIDDDVSTSTISSQLKVLPFNTSHLTPVLFIEQFLKNLMISKQHSSGRTNESEIHNTTDQTTTQLLLTSEYQRKHLSRRHRRNNLTLNILTSDEHKIRQFSINQTHGILIHCNEIRRRQLRELIFRTSTTTYLSKIQNSSSKMFHYDIFSLTIFIIPFLILQKIND